MDITKEHLNVEFIKPNFTNYFSSYMKAMTSPKTFYKKDYQDVEQDSFFSAEIVGYALVLITALIDAIKGNMGAIITRPLIAVLMIYAGAKFLKWFCEKFDGVVKEENEYRNFTRFYMVPVAVMSLSTIIMPGFLNLLVISALAMYQCYVVYFIYVDYLKLNESGLKIIKVLFGIGAGICVMGIIMTAFVSTVANSLNV